ncbi:fatty acid desaturase [Actinocrispum wychmicini]|uniref:Fatty acid desaturase n=1 Tax=Actinocrispum wychmicini TaxID=1213861 RepID=A0A4R2IMZ6_9PSEU|nr:fatty acid desaturase [Actinocrispum wychmicini]
MTTAVRTSPSAPVLAGEKTPMQMMLVKVFAVVPLLVLAAAVPVAWGWGLDWVDVGLVAFFYTLTCLGVTVGFHRYFTHGAFTATRGLRIALVVTGSLAMQGPIIGWVADHRRDHAFADREGDPHSPWLFGTSAAALARGFWHAHMGRMFQRERTNAARFAPDLLADRDLVGELDLPHDRRPPVHREGQVGELLAAGHRRHG